MKQWLWRITIIYTWLFGVTTTALAIDLENELRQAARQGDLAKVQSSIAQGVDVNSVNRYRLSALYYAAERGHTKIVRSLLDAGAVPEVTDEPFYRLSPIVMAARKKHLDVVKLLLAADAKCTTWTPYWPAMEGHNEVVIAIVEARPNLFEGSALDSLTALAKKNENETLFQFFVSRGGKIDPKAIVESPGYKALTNFQKKKVDGIYVQPSSDSDDQKQVRLWARQGKLFMGDELGLADELIQSSIVNLSWVLIKPQTSSFRSRLASRLKSESPMHPGKRSTFASKPKQSIRPRKKDGSIASTKLAIVFLGQGSVAPTATVLRTAVSFPISLTQRYRMASLGRLLFLV